MFSESLDAKFPIENAFNNNLCKLLILWIKGEKNHAASCKEVLLHLSDDFWDIKGETSPINLH